MRLSAEMREEYNFMRARVDALHAEAFSNVPESFHRVRRTYHEELNDYKIQLEIFFAETDKKVK